MIIFANMAVFNQTALYLSQSWNAGAQKEVTHEIDSSKPHNRELEICIEIKL